MSRLNRFFFLSPPKRAKYSVIIAMETGWGRTEKKTIAWDACTTVLFFWATLSCYNSGPIVGFQKREKNLKACSRAVGVVAVATRFFLVLKKKPDMFDGRAFLSSRGGMLRVAASRPNRPAHFKFSL